MSDIEDGSPTEHDLPYGFSTENSPVSPYLSPDILVDVDEDTFDQTEAALDEATNPDRLIAAEDLLENGNIMTKMVIPHPMAITTDAVANIDDVNIPGEITVSKQGKLLRKYLTFEGFTGDSIESFDHMLQYGIRSRLNKTRIDLLNGNYVTVNQVSYTRPQTSTSTDDSQTLTPLMAREQGYTYSGEVYADIVEINGETGEAVNQMKVRLGKIPVMLGSSLDHLRGLTGRQRLELGECDKDPHGYFIIKGTEYIVLLREQLRINRFLMYTDDSSPVCRMTCLTQMGTTIVTLSRDKVMKSVQLSLHFLNKGTINVFQAFRMLGVSDPDQIFEYIRVFTRPAWVKKVWIALRQTYIDYLQIGDDVGVISELRNETLASQGKAEDKTATVEGVDLKTQSLIYTDMLVTDLFPQIPKDQLNNKVYLLSMMIARYSENLAGLRPLDDRDSWSNKRILSAGPAMTQLFGWCWDKMVRLVNRAIDDASKKSIAITLKTVARSLRPTIMTEDFEASFTTHNWGCKNGPREENATDILKRGSLLDAYAHLLQVKTPIDTQTKAVGVRMVSMSQIGYIDPVETPEGEGCGIIKAKATTCWISIERGDTVIRHYLSDNISSTLTPVALTVCILNGMFLGWCSGVALRDYLVKLRRSSSLAKDTMILLDEFDNILWLDTDGQRPTRPLMIINPKTGVLLIEEKKLWGADFPTLLEEGCVEYIDAWEQEYIMLAQSITDVTARRDQLREAIETHERAQADLARVQGGTRLIRATQTEGPGNNVYRMITEDEYEGTLQEDRHEKHHAIEGLKLVIHKTETSIEKSEGELLERHSPDVIQTQEDLAVKQLNDEIESVEHELDIDERDIRTNGEGLNVERERIQALTDPDVQQNSAALYIEHAEQYKRDVEDYQRRRVRFQQTTVNKEILYDNVRQDIRSQRDKEISTHETMVEQLRVMKERLISLYHDVDEPVKIDEEEFMTEEDALEVVRLSASVIRRLQAKKPYSHSEIDPNAILGVAASIIPLLDHNQAPRNVYQCSMGKQALGIAAGNHKYLFGTTTKMLAFPSRPLFETQMNKMLGLDDLPGGEMVVLAIMTYMGYNQEDAIIMKKGAIDRGLFRMIVTKSLVAMKLKNHKIHDSIVTESFERPPPSKGRRLGAYDNLDDRGVARVGTILQVGDCAIGKVRIINENGHQRTEDASTYVKMGENGIVDRVIVSNNGNYPVIKVKVRQMRTPKRGDKFASRHAQKSTVGLILPDEDMPFTAQGITPDMIMNPHAIPSRMTLGNLMEVVASKHAALSGERVNATAFNDFDIDEFRRSLTQYGFSEWGYETMYNGMTGKPFQVQMFIGPCYYQALKHNVMDKIQMRQRGAVQPDTRQPVGGRKHRGGIRFGEMERDALISHGAPAVLQERLCLSSDAYKPVFCKSCGNIAIANHISKQYVCRGCGDDAQFGTCTIPYSFKLLTQLLAGAGIKISLGMSKIE